MRDGNLLTRLRVAGGCACFMFPIKWFCALFVLELSEIYTASTVHASHDTHTLFDIIIVNVLVALL